MVCLLIKFTTRHIPLLTTFSSIYSSTFNSTGWPPIVVEEHLQRLLEIVLWKSKQLTPEKTEQDCMRTEEWCKMYKKMIRELEKLAQHFEQLWRAGREEEEQRGTGRERERDRERRGERVWRNQTKTRRILNLPQGPKPKNWDWIRTRYGLRSYYTKMMWDFLGLQNYEYIAKSNTIFCSRVCVCGKFPRSPCWPRLFSLDLGNYLSSGSCHRVNFIIFWGPVLRSHP